MEEGIQRLKEIGMSEWICHLRPMYPYRKGPENISFTTTVRNKLVRGAPTSLKNSVIALLYRPGLIAGTAVTELENLNVMGVIESQRAGIKWQPLTAKGKVLWLP